MGRRTYGAVSTITTNQSVQNENNAIKNEVKSNVERDSHVIVCETKESANESIVEKEKEEKPKKSLHPCFVAMFVVLVFAVLGFIIGHICTRYLDIGNGANAPDEAAIKYVTAIANNDPKQSVYLPPEIRNSGYAADIYGLSSLKAYDEKYDVILSNVEAVIDAQKLEIAPLEDSLEYVYGKRVDISDAKLLTLTADMSYESDGESQVSPLTFNIISIKSNKHWYIYTGNFLTEDVTEDESTEASISEDVGEDITITDEESVTNEPSYEIIEEDSTIGYVEPVIKEDVEIDFYDEALSDLKLGKVKIDGVDYVLPEANMHMSGLYELVDASIDANIRQVKPNYILKNLPIKFINEDYGMTEFSISVGNASDDSIDVSEGIVTTLYVGLPKSEYAYNVYDYPDVYLPGNITLTSTYNDVVSLYGELEPYTGDNKSLYMYSDNVKIYQVNLHDNLHNHLYLEFENDVLVAIQWHFYDLNAF